MTGRLPLVAAAVAALFALPAAGQDVYMPSCPAYMWDPGEQRFFGLRADEDAVSYIGYDVYGLAPGFAFYSFPILGRRDDDFTPVHILEHCESRTRLIARISPRGLSEEARGARSNAVRSAIVDRATSFNSQSYTLQQIADAARAAGAQTEISRGGYQSCGCSMSESLRW